MDPGQYLSNLNKTTKVIISFILVIIIGACDYGMDLVTVGQISFSIFYLLPIVFVTWYADRRTGIILSVFGAMVWHVAGGLSGYFNYNSILPFWNTAVRLGFFLIVVIILSRLKVELQGKTNLVLALQQTLDDLQKTGEQLQQKAEELARSNAELEQFAYVAAHDLRSPLVTIGGYIKMIRSDYKDKLDQEALDMISVALKGVSRMESLIQGLLSYARLGSNIKDFEAIDLNESFIWALSNIEGLITESKAEITCDTLSTVMADDIQMVQLFQNLISNAIRYSCDAECPRIHVSVKKEKGTWVFSVRDNGIGIDAEHFEKIFGLFQRIRGTGEHSGTGIGLSVCKKIVELHGGRIWVESEKGKGSVFYFTIPVSLVDERVV